MAQTVKSPLATFRGISAPASGSKATISIAALAAQTAPASPSYIPYMIVQNVSVSLSGGTSANASLQANLIDGTTGGTGVQWAASLSNGTGGSAYASQANLNIPITSGTVTLEFASGPAAGSTQVVAISGYHVPYGDV